MKKTETKSLVLLHHHLKALKLPTMHDECEKIAGRCATDNADHLAFLLQLFELELMRCGYIDKRENLLLVGSTGTGKTHLASALGLEACGRGKRVRFHKVIELVTQMIDAREQRQLARLKTQLAKLDLLILDELGYVPTSKLGAELLFDVISTAYERTSVIVTTGLPLENWTEVVLNVPANVVIQRCTHGW